MRELFLILSLSYLWFSARELLGEMRSVYTETNSLKETVKAFAQTVISCGKCFAFWLGLAIAGNVFIAVVASVLFDMYERIKLKLL